MDCEVTCRRRFHHLPPSPHSLVFYIFQRFQRRSHTTHANMQICEFCRTHILESGFRWGKHQDSYEGYKSSALHEMCVFCMKIVKEVLDATKWQSIFSYRNMLKPGSPVYRWTLRKAAKISEISESFIITFREIPASVSEEFGETLVGLPVLTFHMLQERGLYLTVFSLHLPYLLISTSRQVFLGNLRTYPFTLTTACRHRKCSINIFEDWRQDIFE